MLFDRVKEEANKRGLSISDLSLKMGWSEKAIYSWKSSSPSIEKVQQVADFFKVSLDDLMDRSEYREAYDRNLDEDIKQAELDNRSQLIAAHIDDDVTEEEMEDIIKYINFLKSKHDM